MTHLLAIGLLSSLLMLAIACSPASTTGPFGSPSSSVDPLLNNSPVASAPSSPSATLVANLKSWLSQEISIPVTDISIRSFAAVDWSDACLEVSQPDQMCAQVVTPGYRFLVTTSKGDYGVHSDRSGQSFRIAQTPSPSP